MPLVDYEIEEFVEKYSAVLPFNRELINPASIDIRIGDTLFLPGHNSWTPVFLSKYSQDNPFLFTPGSFILVDSLEFFNLPSCMTAQFKLKSSRAREGYSHPIAGFCDPGWHGSRLTMELHNVHPYDSLPIYTGLRIGQMIFEKCNPPRRSYAQTGRYNNDQTVSASKG